VSTNPRSYDTLLIKDALIVVVNGEELILSVMIHGS